VRLSELYLLDLPSEATLAFRVQGAVWEFTPQCCESGTAYLSYDSDTQRYNRYFIEHGWRAEYHVLEHAVWSVDSDGDWEADSCSVDDPLYEAFILTYEYPAIMASWGGYYEHVIKTKDDYLGEFFATDPVALRKAAKKALRQMKKDIQVDQDVRKPRLLQDPNGLIHHATYNRIHLWRTACGHYFPNEHKPESSVISCLACLGSL